MRIMIFGKPGSGKSTYATWLAQKQNIPLYHLDKFFYSSNWIERDYAEFLRIQQEMVDKDSWIIDGNNLKSLEMRWQRADIVLYFNYPTLLCFYRVLKRFFYPNKFGDRASGCEETIRLSLLKYIWHFERRVSAQIIKLQNRYPQAVFKEIRNDSALKDIKW